MTSLPSQQGSIDMTAFALSQFVFLDDSHVCRVPDDQYANGFGRSRPSNKGAFSGQADEAVKEPHTIVTEFED